MNNNKRYVYLCKRIPKTKPIEYEDPIKIEVRFNYFSIMSASGYTNATAYGQDIVKVYTALANIKYFSEVNFNENDLMYIEGLEPSNDEEYYGERANAEIDSVRYQNKYITLTIKKRKILND